MIRYSRLFFSKEREREKEAFIDRFFLINIAPLVSLNYLSLYAVISKIFHVCIGPCLVERLNR